MSLEDLEQQVATMRSQLAVAQRKAARVLARHQQHLMSMEVVKQKNEELDAVMSKLAEQERANRELIERLQLLVTQLSTPILRVAVDVLALPVVGILDEERALAITTRLLEEVSSTGTKCVIVDLTGVEAIDAPTTEHLVKIARATQLLGARCILCGLQPAIASQMMDLDVILTGIETTRNLHQALGLATPSRT